MTEPGAVKFLSMSKDMPSTCTRCWDSMKTSCTLEMAPPSQGETAEIVFPYGRGGVSAAMMRSVVIGASVRGRLQLKYEEADAADEGYDGADEELSSEGEKDDEG